MAPQLYTHNANLLKKSNTHLTRIMYPNAEGVIKNNKKYSMAGFKFPMDNQYSKFLFYSSFCMGVSAFIAYIMNDLYITTYLILLFLSSINHWRQPEYGLRRNIDLTVVAIGVFYVLFKIFLLKDEFHRAALLIFGICGVIMFIFEYVLEYLDSPKWIIFHMTLHIYVSCAALLMIFD